MTNIKKTDRHPITLAEEYKLHTLFVSEDNLQDPPVRPSIRQSVTFLKKSCDHNSS